MDVLIEWLLGAFWLRLEYCNTTVIVSDFGRWASASF
jgi:hypothetical protein